MTDASTRHRATEYRPGRFRIDDFGPYPGYHRPGVEWNGWAAPAFERDIADRIATDFEAQGDRYTVQYDERSDAFVFGDPDNDWEDDVFMGMEAELWDEPGSVRSGRLYAVGAFVWTWTEAAEHP